MNKVMNDFPEPSLQMKQIQRCPNYKRRLVLTEEGKCQECGEQVNNYLEDQKGVNQYG